MIKDFKNWLDSVLNEAAENFNPNGLKPNDGCWKGKGNNCNNPEKIEQVKKMQQLLIDKGFLKINKPTGYYGNLTAAALQKAMGQKPAAGQAKAAEPAKMTKLCQEITPKSDLTDLAQIVDHWKKLYPTVDTYSLINRTMEKFAALYQGQGIPARTSCELALLRVRPGYKDKNAFIVDTRNKLIYLFDAAGKFIAKTETISGEDKQSTDPTVIAKALLTWEEKAKEIGFKWVSGKGYVDTTGKGRKYKNDLVYNAINTDGGRFLPKGIYTTKNIKSDSEYAGVEDNMLMLFSGDKMISQAIHGYYPEQPRTEALKKAEEVLTKPTDPRVGKEFLDLVKRGGANLSQSYGCLNVPNSFVPYLKQYGQNSYVFNMGEDAKNYLVNNTQNFFDRMQNTDSCPTPQSLGAIPVVGIA